MNFKTIALALCVGLSGCATKDHIYNADGACLTCFNNPFTGEALNHDGTNNKHMEVGGTATEDGHVFNVSADVHVDTIFTVLYEEFNVIETPEFNQHESYTLISRALLKGTIPVEIKMQMKKISQTKTFITVTYKPRDEGANLSEIGREIKSRVNKAVGNKS